MHKYPTDAEIFKSERKAEEEVLNQTKGQLVTDHRAIPQDVQRTNHVGEENSEPITHPLVRTQTTASTMTHTISCFTNKKQTGS